MVVLVLENIGITLFHHVLLIPCATMAIACLQAPQSLNPMPLSKQILLSLQLGAPLQVVQGATQCTFQVRNLKLHIKRNISCHKTHVQIHDPHTLIGKLLGPGTTVPQGFSSLL